MNTPDTENVLQDFRSKFSVTNGKPRYFINNTSKLYNEVEEYIIQTRQEAILEGQRRAVGYLLSKLPKLNKMFGGETYYTLPESLLEQARTLPVTEK